MEQDDPIQNGLFYHIYNRGNDRGRIFKDDRDYLAFIGKMKSLATQRRIEVPVYTLMPNHYHFIARQDPEGDLPGMMGALATSTAKRYNLKYSHIGHLFQGPYRRRFVDEDVLWYVACYIHLNPVRARLVKDPAEWEFSNFGAFEAGEPELDSRALARDYLQPWIAEEEGNLERSIPGLWHGYAAYVRQVLTDEREQKEWEARLRL